ncbi:hypothetical protein, partial [Vibrio vulnificus]|uniref:hypothetical protein n=1 Tax=Vibrio vulnificus TaxID=672 RepID=UPI001029DFCD
MKRILKYLLPTMMGLTLLGCNQDDAIVLTDNSLNKTLTKIVVSADTTKPSGVDGFNVPINNSLTLIATAEYSDSTTQNITQYVAWQVSNLDIGSIEDNIFTAKKTGNVTITASYRDIVSENSVKINV